MPPAWLQAITTDTFPSDVIGVAIWITDARHGQLHVGVLHRVDARQACILGVNWHARLANDPTPETGWWVDARLPAERIETFAAQCRRIHVRNRDHGLPYGIRFEGGSVAPDGQIRLRGRTQGLTCATFVLLVFDSAGLPLLQTETWPSRADDRDWHEWVIQTLRSTKGVTPEHVENIARERDCARYRPEEVAAGCAREDRPSSFEVIEPMGRELRTALLPPPTAP